MKHYFNSKTLNRLIINFCKNINNENIYISIIKKLLHHFNIEFELLLLMISKIIDSIDGELKAIPTQRLFLEIEHLLHVIQKHIICKDFKHESNQSIDSKRNSQNRNYQDLNVLSKNFKIKILENDQNNSQLNILYQNIKIFLEQIAEKHDSLKLYFLANNSLHPQVNCNINLKILIQKKMNKKQVFSNFKDYIDSHTLNEIKSHLEIINYSDQGILVFPEFYHFLLFNKFLKHYEKYKHYISYLGCLSTIFDFFVVK